MRFDLSCFPHRGYVTTPTPIEPMPNLRQALDRPDLNLFVKRDDLLPGTAGGNKTRKLDFCLADALQQQADCVVTCGAVQSNHCRLTAAWCAKEQLPCHLVLEERIKGSYSSDASGNNFLFQLLGVESTRVVPGGSDMMKEMEATAEKLRQEGKKPYIIPGGASNPLGALGYASCAQEIIDQLEQMQLKMDYVLLASGSGGTHAGISLLPYLNENIQIYGINTAPRSKEVQEERIHQLATATADLLGLATPPPRPLCFEDYVGPGYSLPTDGMIEAVELFAKTEAILLDPVYTGKAAAGFIDLIRKGEFPAGSNILFLHTGGSPALYAYLDTFRANKMANEEETAP